MCMTQQPQMSVLQAAHTELKAASETKQAKLVHQLEKEQVSGVSWHH